MEPTLRTSDAPRFRAGSMRELAWVALPLVVSSGASSLMYVVDRVFLSWYSVDAMAAALPAGVLHWNLAALALGTVGYANAFVAQYYGARDLRHVGPLLWQSIYLSCLAALFVLLFIPLAPALFERFDHDSQLQDLEVRYFSIMCMGTLPLLLSTALACFYSGRGQT